MRNVYYVFAAVGVFLAAVAAYISVSGMAKVFAGSAVTVMVAMSAVEAGKLVCASLAYRLRRVAPLPLTLFLVLATLGTMLITSAGIYGFLSAAYQESASRLERKEAKVSAVDSRVDRFQARIDRLDERRSSILSRQAKQEDRLEGLSDKYAERGWASDKEAVERAQDQLNDLEDRLQEVSSKIEAQSDSVFALESRRLEIQNSDVDVEAKLSTVQFISDTLGIPRDQAANVFILMIIFVFDPVAVCIVLATNIASEKSGGEGLFEDTIEDKRDGDLADERSRESKATPLPAIDRVELIPSVAEAEDSESREHQGEAEVEPLEDGNETEAERSEAEVEDPDEETEPEGTADPLQPSRERLSAEGAEAERSEAEAAAVEHQVEEDVEPRDYAEEERRRMRLSDEIRDLSTEEEMIEVIRNAFDEAEREDQSTRFRVHDDGSVTRKHDK